MVTQDSRNPSIDEGIYYDIPGTYTFNVKDPIGDGPNGGILYVYVGDVGTWTGSGVTTGTTSDFGVIQITHSQAYYALLW